MSHYFVRLLIRMGEYEKYTCSIVSADSIESAENEAIMNEAHTKIEVDDDGNCWDDYMIYEADKIEALNDTEYQILRKFL